MGAGSKGNDLQTDRIATKCQGLELWWGDGGAEAIAPGGSILLGQGKKTVEWFAMGEIEMIERFPLVETSLEAPTGLEAQAHETMVVSPRYRSTPDHDGALLLLLAGLEP